MEEIQIKIEKLNPNSEKEFAEAFLKFMLMDSQEARKYIKEVKDNQRNCSMLEFSILQVFVSQTATPEERIDYIKKTSAECDAIIRRHQEEENRKKKLKESLNEFEEKEG